MESFFSGGPRMAKNLLQPSVVWRGAKQATEKQEGARRKPFFSQVIYTGYFGMSSIPLICRTTLVIKEGETRNEWYFFCRNKRTFASISFCRKKKDKKDGAKGLAKAGSAVSLQVRIGAFLLFHDCFDPNRPKRTQNTKILKKPLFRVNDCIDP